MSRETITREEGAFCRTNIIITKGKLTMSQLEIILSEGCTYARKKPGESFNAYACAFCSRLVSYTTVQPNRSQEKRFLGIRCELCGHAFPRRACTAFRKARQPKRRGWRK